MSLKLTRNFKFAAMLLGAAAIGSMTAATSASASPPDVNSKQWNLMHPYAGFITRMKTETQYWCCSWSDGRADMPERWVPPNETVGSWHYQVFAMKEDYNDNYSSLLSAETYNGHLGRWIDVPPNDVIDSKKARAQCEAIRDGSDTSTGEGSPSQNEKDSCRPPPFNVLWISASGHVYCYWPQPKLGMLEQKDQPGLKASQSARLAAYAPAPAPAS